MVIFCLRCGTARERRTLQVPGTKCDRCGASLFSSEPPPDSPVPLKPWELTPGDKRLLKALRIQPDA